MLDWWMIGEGDIKMWTWGSTFGMTACDRTNTSRWSTRLLPNNQQLQCIDPTEKREYLDFAWHSVVEYYERFGVMIHRLET